MNWWTSSSQNFHKPFPYAGFKRMRSPQGGSIAQVKTRQIRVWLDSGLRKKHSKTPLVGCGSGRLERCPVTDSQSHPMFQSIANV